MGESGTAYLAVTCQSLALVQTQAKADSMSDLNSSDMSHFQAKCDAKNAARSLGIIEQRERERGREGKASRGRGGGEGAAAVVGRPHVDPIHNHA